jgi:hypothetical protein
MQVDVSSKSVTCATVNMKNLSRYFTMQPVPQLIGSKFSPLTTNNSIDSCAIKSKADNSIKNSVIWIKVSKQAIR